MDANAIKIVVQWNTFLDVEARSESQPVAVNHVGMIKNFGNFLRHEVDQRGGPKKFAAKTAEDDFPIAASTLFGYFKRSAPEGGPPIQPGRKRTLAKHLGFKDWESLVEAAMNTELPPWEPLRGDDDRRPLTIEELKKRLAEREPDELREIRRHIGDLLDEPTEPLVEEPVRTALFEALTSAETGQQLATLLSIVAQHPNLSSPIIAAASVTPIDKLVRLLNDVAAAELKKKSR